MKDIPFHPLSNEYPLMPAYEMGRLEQGMRDRGFDPRFPIVLYKKQILDGRNRFLGAKAAGVKPMFVTFQGTEEQARLFVMTANEERRHLAQEWLQQRRQERIGRVAAARAEGQSLRVIAEQEGVSHEQVRRDIHEAGVTPVTPGHGSVTGADGKTYSASRPSVSKLIPEIQEMVNLGKISFRLVPEIEALDRNRQAAVWEKLKAGVNPRKALAVDEREPGVEAEETPTKKGKKTRKAPPVREVMKDLAGNDLPDNCRDAFADPGLRNLIDELEQVEAMFRPEVWLARAGKLTDHYGFVLIAKFKEHIYQSVESLQLATEALKAGVPYAVCPKCHAVDSKKDGTSCKVCRGYGHVPETKYKELSA